jgi:hypothetical protein
MIPLSRQLVGIQCCIRVTDTVRLANGSSMIHCLAINFQPTPQSHVRSTRCA